jgi:hypothetical protein
MTCRTLVVLLVLVVFAVPTYGNDDVYLYDDSITPEVDIGKYLSTGEVQLITGLCYPSQPIKGPAPEPYPQVHVWEHEFEHLGASSVQVDGVYFLQRGGFWTKNRMILVLWKLRVPNASSRMASEFENDLTLSLWVDWDQSEMWEKDELEVRKSINLQNKFPTEKETLCIYYLTGFKAVDLDMMMSANHGRGWKKEVRHLWVRGSLAYDDMDVSPDGEQLFGEVEDYQVVYRVIESKSRNH